MPSVIKLMYSKKRIVPDRSLWDSAAHSEKLSFTTTRWLLSVKNSVIQFKVCPLIPYLGIVFNSFCGERYQKLFGSQCTLFLPHKPCPVPQFSRRALLITGESLVDLVRKHTVCLIRCCFVSKSQTSVFISLFPLFCNRLM